MKYRFRKKSEKNNGMKFFIYPVVFFLLGSLLFYVGLHPIIGTYISNIDVVILKNPPKFDKQPRNLYEESKKKPPLQEKEKLVVLSPGQYPSEGAQYGEIFIDTVHLSAKVFYGDSSKQLRQGVGTYKGAYLPGQGRTILLAGHNNTVFHNLKKVGKEDIIKIKTNYGEYKYQIQNTKVAKANDKSAYDLKKKEENLILYTCYPFDMMGLTNQRFFVYAKYISGPKVVMEKEACK